MTDASCRTQEKIQMMQGKKKTLTHTQTKQIQISGPQCVVHVPQVVLEALSVGLLYQFGIKCNNAVFLKKSTYTKKLNVHCDITHEMVVSNYVQKLALGCKRLKTTDLDTINVETLQEPEQFASDKITNLFTDAHNPQPLPFGHYYYFKCYLKKPKLAGSQIQPSNPRLAV